MYALQRTMALCGLDELLEISETSIAENVLKKCRVYIPKVRTFISY